jgi:type I restriction enzyme M protein
VKAAVVVPNGFLTGQDKISTGIRKLLIEKNMLSGVVSMPSNIFATTGTNVSIIFIDKSKKDKDVLLVDASKLGETVKEGKNQKTVLASAEEDKIISIFRNPKDEDQFSIIATSETIANKNYSFSAGQYFNIVFNLQPMSHAEYTELMKAYIKDFENLYKESREVEKEFLKQISRLELG